MKVWNSRKARDALGSRMPRELGHHSHREVEEICSRALRVGIVPYEDRLVMDSFQRRRSLPGADAAYPCWISDVWTSTYRRI